MKQLLLAYADIQVDDPTDRTQPQAGIAWSSTAPQRLLPFERRCRTDAEDLRPVTAFHRVMLSD